MSASTTGLPALARKYRVLSDLRRGVLPPARETLRPLACEFPGALRELDCLPLALLDGRLRAVLEAERGAAPEPWIDWMLAYHERMRLALSAKARLAGVEPSDPRQLTRLASELSLEFDAHCDESFVARVARPPRGRLNSLVFELLEQDLATPRAELEQALFPRLTRA
jgi:hypothetical protein